MGMQGESEMYKMSPVWISDGQNRRKTELWGYRECKGRGVEMAEKGTGAGGALRISRSHVIARTGGKSKQERKKGTDFEITTLC